MPILYYIRHGETDFNVEQRLQGRRNTLLNARGRLQAKDCGELLRNLFARDNRSADDFVYVSSPLQRARETMEIMRPPLRLPPHPYEIDDRLLEISYGEWEGSTLTEIEARMPGMLAERERDKWDFAPPGGESYRELTARIGEWHASLTRDTVVAAHGGGVRALMALFHVMPKEEATHAQIAQGVVYVFADGTMARYA
ncbi:MAG TPA: histidine phosphatase family protein [Xanthobacteraceae bacterium]|jgi:probable phosphoglycerate mutase|nr:histidine phosphatase family protein [Xanthobacteraceae bacterium]